MESAHARIVIAPNCSLSARGAVLFFLTACAPCFGVAGVLTFLGFWPVLPFAGLEMLLLGAALRISLARRNNRQTIDISESDVVVQTKIGKVSSEVMFPRHWAQVKLRRSTSRLHPSRLVIESHGRQCEVGDFLTEEERRSLYAKLAKLIGRVNESPTLTFR
ncbi:MAG TPA: DUF2244 domain-containing protein [Steroidobacteraceae bacterium]